jgi:hypothetical protein
LKVIGTASNVTERHQRESERNQLFASLQKSEASLVAAQKVAHMGSWALNLLTKKLLGQAKHSVFIILILLN